MTVANANWHYPTSILFGNGRIAELPIVCQQLNIKRPLIVTDQGLAELPFIKQVLNLLPTATLFSQVKANPNGDNVVTGVAAYKNGQHDGVIAIGGGSALDAGKAIALMSGQTKELWQFEDIGDNYLKVNEQGMAPMIAIPTTAGTGSEVGRAAVIVDQNTQSKKIIFHPKMMPVKVILDPELSQGLPANITAATGIDAFVHAFEAYCAPGYHPMAEGIALQAMKLIKQNLLTAVNEGTNLQARGNMLVASSMGATAFQKGLGAVHALAHPLGAIYDKHHGLLNAIILPYVVCANRLAIDTKLKELTLWLELEQKSTCSFEIFINWLLDWRQQLCIPNTLAELGIDDSRAGEIAHYALADPSSAGNPIQFNATDYQVLFENAVNGKLHK